MSKLNYTLKQSTDPAANTEHSFVLDASADLLVKYVSVTLVTDANVANRQVHLVFKDASGNEYFRVTAGGTHAASLTRQYSAAAGLGFSAPAVADTNFVIPLPADGVLVPAGGSIATVTTNKQATDNYGVLTAYCERVN